MNRRGFFKVLGAAATAALAMPLVEATNWVGASGGARHGQYVKFTGSFDTSILKHGFVHIYHASEHVEVRAFQMIDDSTMELI